MDQKGIGHSVAEMIRQGESTEDERRDLLDALGHGDCVPREELERVQADVHVLDIRLDRWMDYARLAENEWDRLSKELRDATAPASPEPDTGDTPTA